MQNQDNTVEVNNPRFSVQSGTKRYDVNLDSKRIVDVTDQPPCAFKIGQKVVAVSRSHFGNGFDSLVEAEVREVSYEFGRWTIMFKDHLPACDRSCWPDWPTALSSILANVPDQEPISVPQMDKVRTAQALMHNAVTVLAAQTPTKPPFRECKVALRLLTEVVTEG